MEPDTNLALNHIRYLSRAIGGRGSCTPKVRLAGEYVMSELRKLGLQKVTSEPFMGSPSTYRPYTLAYLAACLGSLLALLSGSIWLLGLAAILSGLGTWAMLAETDFSSNWAQWLLPKIATQNVTGVVPPTGEVRRRAVLFAHLDTHRTPVFYSSKIWHRLFGLLVTASFLSMAAGLVLFGLAALFNWSWLRWIGLLLLPIQAFAMYMVATADRTPHGPGANDNASGVGILLALARRLQEEPLAHTEVTLLFPDCEETGASGMKAFLDAHAAGLGSEAVYVTLDEVGLGAIKYLTADGLILKHRTHPRALDLAREVCRSLPNIKTIEETGLAYTDALPATLRGLIALTVCTVPENESESSDHWHQMSDTIEFIDPNCLEKVLRFTWELLRQIDQ